MKNIILVSYSFIAALIGAGFASGQEILCYFAAFGKAGIIGIAAAAIMFAVFIYAVLSTCAARRLHSLDAFLSIFPNAHIKKLMHLLLIAFSFSVFSAMLSAFGELFASIGVPPRTGALITAAVCAVILSFGSGTVFDINGILGLLLTAAIITCCIYMLRYREYHAFASITPVIGNAGVYSGYNLLSAVPLLALMSRRIARRRDAAAAALIASGAAGLMMLMIFILLATYAGKIPLGELPMLTLAARQNRVFADIYRVILITASATTLLSAGGSIIEAMPVRKTPVSAAVLSIFGFFLSGLGFSGLVNTAYRACGAAGIIVCLYISYICFSKSKYTE